MNKTKYLAWAFLACCCTSCLQRAGQPTENVEKSKAVSEQEAPKPNQGLVDEVRKKPIAFGFMNHRDSMCQDYRLNDEMKKRLAFAGQLLLFHLTI